MVAPAYAWVCLCQLMMFCSGCATVCTTKSSGLCVLRLCVLRQGGASALWRHTTTLCSWIINTWELCVCALVACLIMWGCVLVGTWFGFMQGACKVQGLLCRFPPVAAAAGSLVVLSAG